MGVGGGGVTEAVGWKGWAGIGTRAGVGGWGGGGDEWLRMWRGQARLGLGWRRVVLVME